MRSARHELLTASVAAWLALAAAGCTTELASDLDERQADEIVLALDEAGIGARKERANGVDGSFSVSVIREDLAPALGVLHDRELPREAPVGMESLLADRGLVPSASDEQARRAAATAGELSRSLESIGGVERARVHLALPEPGSRLLDDAPAPARASVLLEVASIDDTAIDDTAIDDTAVRALVSGAVNELAPGDVAVVRIPARGAARSEPRLVTIGPIAVTRGSADLLKALLAGSFALNLVLAALVVLAKARRREPARAPDTGAPENTT